MNANKLAIAQPEAEGLRDDEGIVQHSRVQRMIFVASLYFKLLGIKNPSRDELDEVNSKFNLVHTTTALRFPAAISNIIWRKVDLTDVLSRYKAGEEALSKLVLEMLSKVPSFVKYGDGGTIKRDIQSVFDCLPSR